MKTLLLALLTLHETTSFTPPSLTQFRTATHSSGFNTCTTLQAGGFEWEDPAEAFDQGVENPFKNPELMQGDGDMKIDPARLLGPRLQGSNLYFIGMMGSGKSAVGDVVARRKYYIFGLYEIVVNEVLSVEDWEYYMDCKRVKGSEFVLCYTWMLGYLRMFSISSCH